MKAPQIIFIVLVGLELLMHANKHGQPRENYNILIALFNAVITVGLLWWGGFF